MIKQPCLHLLVTAILNPPIRIPPENSIEKTADAELPWIDSNLLYVGMPQKLLKLVKNRYYKNLQVSINDDVVYHLNYLRNYHTLEIFFFILEIIDILGKVHFFFVKKFTLLFVSSKNFQII